MTSVLYLDASAVLRAVLESGTSPEIELQIEQAPAVITSRLSIVESARAFHRLRTRDSVSPVSLADAERPLGKPTLDTGLGARLQGCGRCGEVAAPRGGNQACEHEEERAPWPDTRCGVGSIQGIHGTRGRAEGRGGAEDPPRLLLHPPHPVSRSSPGGARVDTREA